MPEAPKKHPDWKLKEIAENKAKAAAEKVALAGAPDPKLGEHISDEKHDLANREK